MNALLSEIFRKRPAVEWSTENSTKYELKFPEYAVSEFSLCSDDILLGLEIEVENAEPSVVHHYPLWQLKGDNSLRNGIEYVSHIMRGGRVLYALNQLYSCLPSRATFSPRTSIHVHVNALDLTPKQVGALVLIYAVVEKLLYRFVGHGREKSNFAVPMYDSHIANTLVRNLWAEPFLGVGVTENSRYLGLNLDSIRKFGSLEFRHLHGTRNIKTIVDWINLLLRLKLYVMEKDVDTIKKEVNALNTESNYQAFLAKVFKKDVYLLDQSRLQADLETNVSSVKNAIYENEEFKYLCDQDTKLHYWRKQLTKRNPLVNKDTIVFDLEPVRHPGARRRRAMLAVQVRPGDPIEIHANEPAEAPDFFIEPLAGRR